jgi:hypothetical protein
MPQRVEKPLGLARELSKTPQRVLAVENEDPRHIAGSAGPRRGERTLHLQKVNRPLT